MSSPHGLQDCINPQFQPRTPPSLSQYSLAGEMELGREPILSKNGDEDIGVCSCTTNAPVAVTTSYTGGGKEKLEAGSEENLESYVALGEALAPSKLN